MKAIVWILAACATPAFAQLTITNASTLPAGMVNKSYSVTFTTTGGTGLVTLDLNPSGQSLPAGLSFVSGVLSGTPGSTTGSPFTISVRATDSTIPTPSTTTKSFSLTVLPELQITATSLPAGTVGVAYTQQMNATGGASPYTFNATGLPAGLSINSSGFISGTPTTAGTSSNVIITVADSSSPQFATSRTYSITVSPGSGPSITTASPLPGATVTRPYSQQLAASGGSGTITWGLAPASALPSGINLSTGGLLSGTPTAASAYSFTVRASDGSQSSDKTFALTVNSLPAVGTGSLAVGVVGSIYNTSLSATGGTAPYTWSITSGTLPQGLSLNGTTGAITGTPTATGNPTLGFQVTDANGATASASLPLTVNAGLAISSTSPLPAGTVNSNYQQTLVATGGSGSNSWSIVSGFGTLPNGITLSNTGVLSGTPTTAGTSNFRVRVTDASSNQNEKDFALTINTSSNPITITTASPLANGAVGSSYSQTLAASGGSGTGYTWAVETGSTLPGGLSLGTGTGVLSGQPTSAGAFTFTIRVTDSQTNTTVKTFNLTVSASGFSITTTSVPNWTVGVAYSQALLTSGGTSPFAWAVTTGSLPPGITLGQLTGALTGIPTTPGTYTFTVQATEAGTAVAARQLSIVIASAPTLSPTTLANGVLNTTYATAVSVTGGTAPFTYGVTQGSLPTGVTLTASNGAISGTATAAGTFT
ncbi:MAG: putative Ig domain-containing protein, partial [Bryobacterales bacterium]|nr:putative Ig domain-containing protein [Bryobacterales bacterium]